MTDYIHFSNRVLAVHLSTTPLTIQQHWLHTLAIHYCNTALPIYLSYPELITLQSYSTDCTVQ